MEIGKRFRAPSVFGALCIAAVILLVTALSWEGWIQSSRDAAAPFLVTTSATQIDLGALAPNAEYPVSFAVMNNASQPITILGANCSCSCIVGTSAFPMVVPPNSPADVRFVIHSPPQLNDDPLLYRIHLVCDVRSEGPSFQIVARMPKKVDSHVAAKTP